MGRKIGGNLAPVYISVSLRLAGAAKSPRGRSSDYESISTERQFTIENFKKYS